MRPPRTTRTALLAAVALLTVGLPMASPAGGAPQPAASPPDIQGEIAGPKDRDLRRGKASPDPAQRARAKTIAEGADVRWNAFGTPSTVTAQEPLATGLGSDDEAAARSFVSAERDLLGLDADAVADLEVIRVAPVGAGSVVTFRQNFGDLEAGHDGLLSVAVKDGAVLHVSSSLTKDSGAASPVQISEADARSVAASDAGVDVAAVERVRLVAVPTPRDGVRSAYEVVLIADADTDPVAFTTWVDATNGNILVRESLVDYAVDNPRWKVFPADPADDYSSSDEREIWCWTDGEGCDRVIGPTGAGDPAQPLPWDVDPATGLSTTTTIGNNALAVENWLSANPFTVGTRPATPRPDRDYLYDWTNQWYEEKCNPAVFTSAQLNDIDAASANLFVMHNRMHDWSYRLGFTESAWNAQVDNFGRGGLGNDPERGNAQAGGIVGGPPQFLARDNANQITPPDGVAPITNMYLWQPIPAAFYPPCVDGDFDMSVIGHEYTHLITNRMIAGPNVGLSTLQGGAMGESWSDLVAMEYMSQYGFRPRGDTPYVIGGYVTGDGSAGIRNYDMSKSPLNYSDVGYDIVGPQVHADGEIWSATNFAIRQAFNARYGAGTPQQQAACADGTVDASDCPGNRRWVQLLFDSLLIPAAGALSMVDMRDAMLTADQMRFDGANQDLLWNVFAQRGLGQGASSNGGGDTDPVPSFRSPYANNGTITFKATADGASAPVSFYIGDYEARAIPVADSDPATALGDTMEIVPGTYSGVAVGAGVGHQRFTFTVRPGQVRDVPVVMRANLAAAANGATVTGPGTGVEALIDETEGTNWSSTGQPVAGQTVTVDLAGTEAQQVRRVQVSAMLVPGQNRFSALRAFEILACNAAVGDCSDDASFTSIFVSPDDAFPSGVPRPRAPELILRSFNVPQTEATHLQLRVLANQCTGAPAYAGDQDDDPLNNSDCTTGNPTIAQQVRAAELQVFRR